MDFIINGQPTKLRKTKYRWRGGAPTVFWGDQRVETPEAGRTLNGKWATHWSLQHTGKIASLYGGQRIFR